MAPGSTCIQAPGSIRMGPLLWHGLETRESMSGQQDLDHILRSWTPLGMIHSWMYPFRGLPCGLFHSWTSPVAPFRGPPFGHFRGPPSWATLIVFCPCGTSWIPYRIAALTGNLSCLPPSLVQPTSHVGTEVRHLAFDLISSDTGSV